MVSIFYYTGPYLVPILEKNRSLFGPYRDQIGVGMTLGHTAIGSGVMINFMTRPGGSKESNGIFKNIYFN